MSDEWQQENKLVGMGSLLGKMFEKMTIETEALPPPTVVAMKEQTEQEKREAKQAEELKAKLERLQKATEARAKLVEETTIRVNRRVKLAHVPKPFVGCGMPATIELGVTNYKRKNGKELMELTAVFPDLYKLPHGSDLNLMIWLGTKFVLTGSNVIYFQGVNEALREMLLEPNTQNIEWLKAAITRAHRTMIYYTTGELFKGGSSKGELIVTEIKGLDFEQKRRRHRGEIHVSQAFLDHATIPIDLGVIRDLGRNKIAVSIYLFQQKRNFNNKARTTVFIRPEEAVEHLSLPIGMELRYAKRQIKRGIDAIKKMGLPCMDFNESGLLELPYFPVGRLS